MQKSFFSSLRQASFRGVKFEVEEAGESSGRRLARHEYPLRDTPFAEDLGRKAKVWKIKAFIIQGRNYNYQEARDALRKALTDYGPATLIHPWLGELKVAVERFSLHETTSKGGYCEFDIDFVEAGQRENPSAVTDTAQAVSSSAKNLRKALREAFAKAFAPLSNELNACIAALQQGAALVMEYLALPQALVADGLGYASSLIALPLELFGAMNGMIGGLCGSLNALEALALGFDLGLLGLGASEDDKLDVLSSRGIQSPARNLAILDKLLQASLVDIPPALALKRFVAQVLVIEDAAASANISFDVAEDALARRKVLLDGLDAVAPYASDPVFYALSDVRLNVARDLSTRAAKLPRLRMAQVPATMPALVAAWRLHGDASRADEIVARNRIRHPGRVPGATNLVVLNG